MQRMISTNFVLNVLGAVLPLIAALVTIPIYIAHIGAARYGIVAVVWVLLGYFGFLDFGLSRASVNALSRLAHAGPSERGPVLVTAFYMNLVMGALGGLVLYLISGFLLDRFANLTPDLAAEARAAMPWVACMLPAALVSAIGSGAIESRENFLAANIFQTIGGLLFQIVPAVCAVLIGPSLTVVLPAAFICRFASTLLTWGFVFWSERPVNLRQFDRTQLRGLLGYGAWVSVSTAINPLLETFDQVLIGTLLGPAAIAHYSVPMNLATRSQLLALALVRAMFPRLSRLSAAEAKQLASRALVTLAYGFGAMLAPSIILAGPFLRFWVGDEFARYAIPVAQILLLGAWANGLAFIPYALIQGQGRPDLTAKLHVAEVVPFLAILYFLVTHFGLPGAALAWTFRTVADCLLMLRVGRCWTNYLGRMLPAVGLVAGSWIAAQFVPPTWISSIAAAALIGLAFVVLGFAMDATLRDGARAALAAGRRRWPGASAQNPG